MQAYWIWLSQQKGIDQSTCKRLLSLFPDIRLLYEAGEAQLGKLGLKPKVLEGLLHKDLTSVRQIQTRCAQEGIGILTYGDRAYPSRLRLLEDPPMVLYYMGNLPDLENLSAIGMVGTRKATRLGLSAAEKIARELCDGGAGVISGMAYGIDAAATDGALKAGGTVLGVLGCGIDAIYPAANRELYYRMRSAGCLLSEYPPGLKTRSWNFPERNRIISGLSLGVVMVEAPEKSGSMITARHAFAQNRAVFTVPAPQEPVYGGNHLLISRGARAVTGGAEILSYLGLGAAAEETVSVSIPSGTLGKAATPKKSIDKGSAAPYSGVDKLPPLSEKERAVLSRLSGDAQDMDEVLNGAGISTAEAMAVLTGLEMKGLILRLGRKIAAKI